jgi:hypothetical protein
MAKDKHMYELLSNEGGKRELESAGRFDSEESLNVELERRKTAHRAWLADLDCQARFHARVLDEIKKLLDAHVTSFRHEVREVVPPPQPTSRKQGAKNKKAKG